MRIKSSRDWTSIIAGKFSQPALIQVNPVVLIRLAELHVTDSLASLDDAILFASLNDLQQQ
jgi:hypothetical protein